MEHHQWDIFISHASEDKAEIVEPLANALQHKGLKVWYDHFSLKLGDGLRHSIEEGITHSKYGVVILSPNFFAKKWPQRELDSLTAKEITLGKVILPVWHHVTYEDVLKFSPNLADKLAISTEKGLEGVVQQILDVCHPRIHLRSEPAIVARKDAKEMFGVTENYYPRKYIQNDFEDYGETVIDHRTGLTWQKSGSDEEKTYQEAQLYVKELNETRLGGFTDWRLPTMPELMSLIEEKRQSNGLFINPTG